MARGWESKSVEAQQEAAGEHISGKPRLTPEAVNRLREKEGLRLSLNRIMGQLRISSNAHHRQMLERAKADLERQIKELDSPKI